jgi:hypothetical protein
MSTQSDTASLSQFPITGRAVCEALLAVLDAEQRLVLRDIETLCSSGCEGLGDLWKRTVASRSEVVTVGELVAALTNADQVICLDVMAEAKLGCSLFIEDGDLVENNLR